LRNSNVTATYKFYFGNTTVLSSITATATIKKNLDLNRVNRSITSQQILHSKALICWYAILRFTIAFTLTNAG